MTQDAQHLVSMSDIARLAGVSRATAGNWKSRESDFPEAHSKGSRGPLYEQGVVLEWLSHKGRLASALPEVGIPLHVVDYLRAWLAPEECIVSVLVVLALRKAVPDESWNKFSLMTLPDVQTLFAEQVSRYLNFAEVLLPRDEIPPTALLRVIDGVAEIADSRVPQVASSLFDSLGSSFRSNGSEGSTSVGLRELMVRVAGPGRTIYDPAPGAAQLLIGMVRISEGKRLRVFGQEGSRRSWALAKLNLFLQEVEADLKLGDTLIDDLMPGLQADRIVTVPPFMMILNEVDAIADDPRWIWGEPGRNSFDASMAWIQHCIHHLDEGGRAVVVVPPGLLFQQGRIARSRQLMVKSGFLDTVISLPSGSLPFTNIASVMLVFVKGRRLEAGQPPPVLMVDAEGMSTAQQRRNVLDAHRVELIASISTDWTQGVAPSSPFATVANYGAITENGFDLSPRRYVTSSGEPLDRRQLLDDRARLRRQLDADLSSCAVLDLELRDLLKETL